MLFCSFTKFEVTMLFVQLKKLCSLSNIINITYFHLFYFVCFTVIIESEDYFSVEAHQVSCNTLGSYVSDTTG